MSTRPAAVAGSFYSGNSAALRELVQTLLLAARHQSSRRPKVLLVPHAGYVYSGATAAQAYGLLESEPGEAPSRVVLLGPAHRVYLEGMAVPSVDSFTTPLGEVSLDREGIAQALQQPGVCTSDEAHSLEHSLEVQLPFLQQALGSFALTPIVVGKCPPATVGAVIDALWGGPETLIVVSTDLSHFHDYDTAQKHDQATCDRILAGDTGLKGTDACGAAVVNGLFHSENGSALECELLAHCNSGDSSGDLDRVVGYAAFALH